MCAEDCGFRSFRFVWRAALVLLLLSNSGEAGTKNYTLALSPKSLKNPFFAFAREGCVDAARRLGVTCLFIGSEEKGNGEVQAAVLREYLRNGSLDGLAISVSNVDVLSPVIDEATSMGLPVITFDSDAPESSRRHYIGTDNHFFGVQIGKLLMQLKPNGGTYAMISSTEPNIQARERGCRDSIRETNEGAEWVEVPQSPSDSKGDPTASVSHMEEFASANNLTAIALLQGAAMRSREWEPFVDRHRDLTLVVGDAMPNQLDLLDRQYASALVGQLPYEMGRLSVEVLVRLLEGETIERDFIGTNTLQHVLVPLVLPEHVVDHNFIGNLRYVGYILFGLTTSCALIFACWMWLNRKVQVIVVAQPGILIMVASGVVVMASAMVPLSFDDSYVTADTTVACMAVPWLGFFGFTTTFSGLFAKTWRVNQIFRSGRRFRRCIVSTRQLIMPFSLLMTVNVAVLTCWSILNPLRFVRKNHHGTDGWDRVVSTYGVCTSDNSMPYVVALAVINLGVLIVANWQVYEARFVRVEFSESKHFGLAMGSMLQASLIGIPLLFVVRDNPQAYYLVLTFMLFVVSVTILVAIFVPKIVIAHEHKDWTDAEQSQRIRQSIRMSQQSNMRGESSAGSNMSASRSLTFQNVPSSQSVSTSPTSQPLSSANSRAGCSMSHNIRFAIEELVEEGTLVHNPTEGRRRSASSITSSGQSGNVCVVCQKRSEDRGWSASIRSSTGRLGNVPETGEDSARSAANASSCERSEDCSGVTNMGDDEEIKSRSSSGVSDQLRTTASEVSISEDPEDDAKVGEVADWVSQESTSPPNIGIAQEASAVAIKESTPKSKHVDSFEEIVFVSDCGSQNSTQRN